MTQTNPTVSVIIPTYNRAADLQRAMESVTNQTYSDWELIVVDNHSSDNTEQVVESFQGFRVRFERIRNNGIIAASRNRGMALSKGKYLAFLDSDDWWRPTKLEKAVATLERGVDVVYHPLLIASPEKRPFYKRKTRARKLKSPVFRDLLVNGNPIPNSSVVVRKDLADRVGPISEDPDHRSWEDYDYWMRLARVSDRFQSLVSPLGHYWLGEGNTSNDQNTLKNLERFLEKYRTDIEESCGGLEPCWVVYTRHRLGQRAMTLGTLFRRNTGCSPAMRFRMLMVLLGRKLGLN